MSGFVFRLEAVKRLYESQRDEQRELLAQVFEKQRHTEEQYLLLQQEMANQKEHARKQQEVGQVNVDWLLQHKRFELDMAQRVRDVVTQLRQLDQEVEEQRLQLVEADRQVKLMEKLREKHLDRYKQAEAQRETKFLDEMSSIQFTRRALEDN